MPIPNPKYNPWPNHKPSPKPIPKPNPKDRAAKALDWDELFTELDVGLIKRISYLLLATREPACPCLWSSVGPPIRSTPPYVRLSRGPWLPVWGHSLAESGQPYVDIINTRNEKLAIICLDGGGIDVLKPHSYTQGILNTLKDNPYFRSSLINSSLYS